MSLYYEKNNYKNWEDSHEIRENRDKNVVKQVYKVNKHA